MLPELVDVVRSDAVDEAASAVTEELDELQMELDTLRRRADMVELDAEQSRRRTKVGCASSSTLERVFAEDAAVTRAGLEAALDGARRAAERRISAAHQEVDGPVANLAPASPISAHRRSPSARVLRRVPVVSQGASGRSDDAASSTVRTVLGGAGPPSPGIHRNSEPTIVAGRSAAATGCEAHPSPDLLPVPGFADGLSPPADPFARFWVADVGVEPRPGATSSVVDVLLPLIAVSIILMVVFSWVG